MPSRRSTKLRLRIDHDGQQLIADGSDFLVVIAEVTDDNGNVRRLAKDNILFSVEGEGEIIGDASIGANPRAVEFGSAPVLIRSTRQAGKSKSRPEFYSKDSIHRLLPRLNLKAFRPVCLLITLNRINLQIRKITGLIRAKTE